LIDRSIRRRPREERVLAEERREQIVRVCGEAIAERGYSATSVREIAARAGVSVGTLLHHFGSKDAILAAALQDAAKTWNRGEAEILGGPGTPLARLERLVEWLLTAPLCDRLWRIYTAFMHEAVFDEGLEASVLQANAEWDAALTACIQEAIDAGELAGDDPELIGQSLTTLVEGVAIQVHGRLGRWDRERGIRHCLDFLESHRTPAAAHSARSCATVRALVDAWNSHDVERICAFFHDDFENWQAPLPTVRGLDAYRAHLAHWFDAWPDLRLEIVTLFADGDRVCLETSATGSASAAFFDADPSSNGEPGVNRALDVLELRDGRVWRERGYWDFSLFAGAPSPLLGGVAR
jgi:AcrR family transcriptional regulator